jgi:hypothetical protein
MSKSNQPPKENIWDRRPWPKAGDSTMEKTYEAVGRALSSWEIYEGILSVLFSVFVTPNLSTRAGMRAYSAVRTFEGRAEMLRAASQAYFEEQPETDFQNSFKAILSSATCFAPRRNEITHAAVGNFKPLGGELTDTYALYPSYASFKHRDLKNQAAYCMTSVELDYFSDHFRALQTPVTDLMGKISVRSVRLKHS